MSQIGLEGAGPGTFAAATGAGGGDERAPRRQYDRLDSLQRQRIASPQHCTVGTGRGTQFRADHSAWAHRESPAPDHDPRGALGPEKWPIGTGLANPATPP